MSHNSMELMICVAARLLEDGSIRRLHLTNAAVDKAFSGPLGTTQRKAGDVFIDIF